MKYALRDYQQKGIDLLRQASIEGYKKIILHLATGAGKGLVMSEIAHSVLSKGGKILIVMRRRELIFQTCANFLKYHKIIASPIMSGVKGYDDKNPCQVGSIDTIKNYMKIYHYDHLQKFDVVLIDECHDTNSPTYQEFLNWVKPKTYLGMTATPYSIGGNTLKFWEKAICPVQPKELRDQGFLCKARVFCPAEIDTSGLKMTSGDFNLKDLAARASENKIVGDIVQTYIDRGENKPAILFAINKEHSAMMAQAFRSAGIPAIHQDESHNSAERQSAIKSLQEGRIKVLCNVNIFSTGVDIPEARVGIMARPTMSKILWIQQGGRLLRPFPGKEYAIILDHGGNTARHGHFFEERSAELEIEMGPKKPKEKTFVITTCPQCFFANPGRPRVCESCEHILRSETEREIKEAAGELIEVDVDSEMFRIFHIKKRIKEEHERLVRMNQFRPKPWKKQFIEIKLYEKFKEDVFIYDPLFSRWSADRAIENLENKKAKK